MQGETTTKIEFRVGITIGRRVLRWLRFLAARQDVYLRHLADDGGFLSRTCLYRVQGKTEDVAAYLRAVNNWATVNSLGKRVVFDPRAFKQEGAGVDR